MPETIANVAILRKPKTIGSGLGYHDPGNKPSSDPAIWRRAYEKWEAAGNPPGDGMRFWSEAAQEILQGK
jgi:hypothetical protein